MCNSRKENWKNVHVINIGQLNITSAPSVSLALFECTWRFTRLSSYKGSSPRVGIRGGGRWGKRVRYRGSIKRGMLRRNRSALNLICTMLSEWLWFIRVNVGSSWRRGCISSFNHSWRTKVTIGTVVFFVEKSGRPSKLACAECIFSRPPFTPTTLDVGKKNNSGQN